jgi:threonine dehydratase
MIPLAEIEAARSRIAPYAVRTPLVRLPVEGRDAIWLKLENLQPFACFKIRAAANLFGSLADAEISRGVMTASAGNWAQAVAFMARERGVRCTVVVPETSPENKRRAIASLGAEIVVLPFAEWWKAIVTHRHPGLDFRFLHPVEEQPVMAGNGTAGLEILEDLPDVDTVLVPFGGGGLSCGISSALRQRGSAARVHPVEVTTSAKVVAAVDHGSPRWIDTEPSFVDGIGGNTVLDPMWPLVQELLEEPLLASPDEVAEAVRILAGRSRIVAEGAGATPVAVALADRVPRRPGEEERPRRIVCVVSGGNVEMGVFQRILAGETPASAR